MGVEAATPSSFNDFRPFNGFNTPMVKQYARNVTICDTRNVAFNVYSANKQNFAAKTRAVNQVLSSITVGLLSSNF
ncbi:unnamed protein product [Gongylonema pulchrum]|uniref:TonB-dependent receptor n=1 Tax=Gongylonema pulchrum TaxID=637853 RepID=A0A183DJ79_9BILA|nr:unnamed protein product [Gongylonema pulchrum]